MSNHGRDDYKNYYEEENEKPCPINNVDKAREFLIGFMKCEFEDKTFTNYINNELAGDFACELKKAIVKIVWKEK